MNDLPLLSITLLLPLAACLLTLLIPSGKAGLIKGVNAIAGLGTVALALVIWVGYDMGAGGYQLVEDVPWVDAFGIRYTVAVDGVGVVLVLLNAIVFFTGVLTMWALEERVKEYFAFMALLVFGVFGVFVSLDVFVFFFFYEVAVLPMYPLIAIWGSTRKEYSAMKLTLYLMVGSALLFPGLIALFVEAGATSWNIELLRVALSGEAHEAFQIFVFPFIYVGFGILAGMWPFHGWSPTGHVAAPTAVSMLHAGVLMKLGAFGILRIGLEVLPVGAAYWAPTFAVLATVGIVYGAFVAMRQTDFKYVIGFSSVSHMGIVLLGLNTLGVDGTSGAVFQMFAHGIMTALFFSAVGFIYDQTHDRDIRHFGGLSTQVPLASGFFIVAALCGVGVPGFASFWAELLVFLEALNTYPVLGALSIIGLVFTALYALRVLGKAMFGPANPKWDHLQDAGAWASVPRVILIGVLVLFGFFPSLILDMIRTATAG
ncbi:MAG: NADH-quinone oxidoreductase subunit M [Proteobacteria bacterium]|nr:MAG: NADH-quinone oxidoreductase subunit M [Pseudomonadota bacterium]